jgi:hypothetical protein
VALQKSYILAAKGGGGVRPRLDPTLGFVSNTFVKLNHSQLANSLFYHKKIIVFFVTQTGFHGS